MSSKRTPPQGFVHLILFCHENEDSFYLEIPIHIITPLCRSPRKYLRYLGWCVLGVEGTLVDSKGNEVDLSGALTDQGIYQYIVPGEDALAHAVDLEVIKESSQVSYYDSDSESTRSSDFFPDELSRRDGLCVFTGLDGVGMYIIPYQRGDEWLQLIIHNRPHCENLDSLTIDDIRNRIFVTEALCEGSGYSRQFAVLKTPNPILEMTDIPDRPSRILEPGVSYPDDRQYSMQWLVPASDSALYVFPNNNDAAFKDQTLLKPSDVLLHYRYGATAVKQWGKNVSVLTNRPGVLRPPEPRRAPMRLEKTVKVYDLRNTKKRVERASQEEQGSRKRRKTHSSAQDSSAQNGGWDEDDVVLFFWGNSKVARERRAREEEEQGRLVDEWRTAVTGSPLGV